MLKPSIGADPRYLSEEQTGVGKAGSGALQGVGQTTQTAAA